ncbi:MAG: endonuclease III [Victivallales bacterium]|nr:endonuclease III [Victivallales bacterium]
MENSGSGVSRKKMLRRIYDILFSRYGICSCPLHYGSPFQLLVAVELSAQCTDVRVNVITRELFRHYPDAPSLARAPVERVEELIKSGGLFRNKARNLVRAARSLVDDYGGEVPRALRELTQLAGIGRKSANVILGNAFGIPGFPVDTHVKRVLRRLGFTDSETPEKIEAEVNELIAPEYWTNLSHLLIMHGRDTCIAGNPKCRNCSLNKICRYYRSRHRGL